MIDIFLGSIVRALRQQRQAFRISSSQKSDAQELQNDYDTTEGIFENQRVGGLFLSVNSTFDWFGIRMQGY